MNKFNSYIQLIEDEIFKAASPEEVKERQAKYPEIEILSRSTKNADGSLDFEGDVNLDNLKLKELPDLNINKVNGYFNCSHNKLTSLKGCPKIVNGYFSCSSNNLTSLEGCPREINGDFYCENNKKKFTEQEVRQYCNVKGVIHV